MSKNLQGNLGNFISLGYVRTPDDEVARIADLISPVVGPGPMRLLDPCCGEGFALLQLQDTLEVENDDLEVITYGTEADKGRADTAEKMVDQCLWAPYQDARWDDRWVDVMLLNPPYAGGKLELQFLREMQDTFRRGGLLFYIIRQQNLTYHIAHRLAGYFDVLAVYPFLPENFEAYDQIVVVARRRNKRLDKETLGFLRAVGRAPKETDDQGELLDASPSYESHELWGYPAEPFEVNAPGGRAFYLRRRDVLPEELAADAERFGVRSTRWWQDRIEATQELESSTLLPLRDTQIANLLFLGFADNREFSLDGHRYLFRGQTKVEKVNVSTEKDSEEDRIRHLEMVKQGGVMLALETGEVRELDPAGILHLVRAHAGAFAQAVTDHVPALRKEMTLEDWEDRVLDQVYRHKRLPGRAEYGLTDIQKVVAAVSAQAIREGKSRVVVLNADTGSGKTGMAFGAALCLRHAYLSSDAWRWFSEPQHRGGNRRRRMRMNGSGGSSRRWMRMYKHPKPFCIAFAAEPHTLNKMAKEAQECLPLSVVRVAENVADVEAFVEMTKQLDYATTAVLIVPKSMSKLGSGWTWAAFRGHGTDSHQVDHKRPYHCPDCGAVAVYEVKDEDGAISTFPIYVDDVEERLAAVPARCRKCNGPMWQLCRTDYKNHRPLVFSHNGFFQPDYSGDDVTAPPDVRYPVAQYIYERYRDFFDIVIWDEAHDANGVGTDIVAAYRYLTSAAREGWIEATASNMNGKASGVFTRAFHSSPEVRQRFQFGERAEFVNAFGVQEHVTKIVEEVDKAGRYTGRTRKVTRSHEAPGVQPHLTLLMVPHTISLMIDDLGAPLPPRLEVCDELYLGSNLPTVAETYRGMHDFETKYHPRARPSKYQACLAYPNAPWNTEKITEIVYDEDTGRVERDSNGDPVKRVLHTAEPTWSLHDTRLLPKEKFLLKELDRALAEGHGISVMIAHVERGIQERLAWVFEQHLGRPDLVRYCTASARRREAWYTQCVRDGVKVIISHPRKLRTGLDLIHYPWIYFYQPVPNLYTMIQAKGRAWRLGQRWPCETHFLYYAKTMEHRLLQQQADKMIADNLLRGGELSGGLMSMGRQMQSMESTREALQDGDLRHLGVLLEQEAIGDWLPPEEIAAHDAAQRAKRREEMASLRERGLQAIQHSFQMALL